MAILFSLHFAMRAAITWFTWFTVGFATSASGIFCDRHLQGFGLLLAHRLALDCLWPLARETPGLDAHSTASSCQGRILKPYFVDVLLTCTMKTGLGHRRVAPTVCSVRICLRPGCHALIPGTRVLVTSIVLETHQQAVVLGPEGTWR